MNTKILGLIAFLAGSVMTSQAAFAINAFEVKCQLSNEKTMFLEHYIVLPSTHGGSGTILDQARVYNSALDSNSLSEIVTREEDFNSVDGSFNLKVTTGSLEAVIEVPGLSERVRGSHSGVVTAKGQIGDEVVDLQSQTCSVFLN